MSENLKERGLFKKYHITKSNGETIDPMSDFFVLRLDYHGDQKHASACRKAVIKYADEIKEHLPQLSKDLYYKYSGMNEGQVTYMITRSRLRKAIGNVLCFLGLHRSHFNFKNEGTISYRYCVRCGTHKRDGF